MAYRSDRAAENDFPSVADALPSAGDISPVRGIQIGNDQVGWKFGAVLVDEHHVLPVGRDVDRAGFQGGRGQPSVMRTV